jgi:TonB family protein
MRPEQVAIPGGSMSVRPILRPDAQRARPSQRERASSEQADSVARDPAEEIAQVEKKLAAAGGGAVSHDLALDLVLNELVEQARQMTRANGAAIALESDGEMICRASTGNAPDLGTRVDTTSGLSGTCLNTGTIQQCSDTEQDSRVDAEGCRVLELRSMLLVPIADGEVPFGILEVFSSVPQNFGEKDVKNLQSLARKIASSKKASEDGSKLPSPAGATPDTLSEKLEGLTASVQSWESESPSPEPEQHKKNDILSSALVVLVIAAAVLLGVVIGVRQTMKGGTQVRTNVAPAKSADATASAAHNPSAAVSSKSQPAFASLPQSRVVQAPVGGLVVTQNGKVIYRGDPSQDIPGIAKGPEDPANRLVHRVDPQYPEAARAQHIEGPVVLEAQVLSDGSIGNIAVVEGNPLLAEAATQAVRQWKYQPYTVDGRPAERQKRITVKFSLPSS